MLKRQRQIFDVFSLLHVGFAVRTVTYAFDVSVLISNKKSEPFVSFIIKTVVATTRTTQKEKGQQRRVIDRVR